MSKRKGLYYVYQVQKTAKQQKNYLKNRGNFDVIVQASMLHLFSHMVS